MHVMELQVQDSCGSSLGRMTLHLSSPYANGLQILLEEDQRLDLGGWMAVFKSLCLAAQHEPQRRGGKPPTVRFSEGLSRLVTVRPEPRHRQDVTQATGVVGVQLVEDEHRVGRVDEDAAVAWAGQGAAKQLVGGADPDQLAEQPGSCSGRLHRGDRSG